MNYFLKKLIVIFFISLPFFSYGQTIEEVKPFLITGTYAKGSSITVPVKVSGCFKPDNKFEIYLSADFSSNPNGTLIGDYRATYITFINGLIPSSSGFSPQPGVVYQVKIKSTSPAIEYLCPTKFSISANTAPSALISTSSENILLQDSIFGLCQENFSNEIMISLAKASNSNANSLIGCLKDESTTNLTENINLSTNPFINNYVGAKRWSFFVKATGVNGDISTRGYVISNLTTATGLITYKVTGCAPEELAINIPIEGIQNNDPACQYQINWGDGLTEIKSHCEVMAASGDFSHNYTASSCNTADRKFTITVTTLQSLFVVPIGNSPSNPQYCPSATSPVKSSVVIGLPEKADFTMVEYACQNTNVVFTNISDPGTVPIMSLGVVTSCNANPPFDSKWHIDKSPITSNSVFDYWYYGLKGNVLHNYNYTFSTIGLHTVSLKVQNRFCPTVQVKDKTICIEKPPIARFGYNTVVGNGFATSNGDTSFCYNNAAFTIPNRSNVMSDSVPCTNATYVWLLKNSGNTTISSQSTLHFLFPLKIDAGVYTLTLTTTNSCGSNSIAKTITVLLKPSITQPVDRSICEGDNTTFAVTAGGANLTYQWQVSSGGSFSNITNGGVYSGATTGTLTITAASASMNGYQYKVIVSGDCPPSVISDIKTLTVKSRPTSFLSGNATICNGASTNLTVALTGATPWIITYSDGTTVLNVTKGSSPTTISVSPITNKTYTITALSDANCSAISNDNTGSAAIIVNPLPTVSGNTSICVNGTSQLTGSATSASPTAWVSATPSVATVDNNGLITGISGGISIVTYTNTNGCQKLTTVTVNALPIISGQPSLTNQSVCINTPVTALSIIATAGSGTGPLYQWYSNTSNNNTTGTLINGANLATYTPSNNLVGTKYYYCIVTNSNGCALTSNVSGAINIYSLPTISQQPVAANYCKDAIATALSVSGSAGGLGTLSYQWYSNTSATTTNAVAINGQIATTYIPSTITVGTIYYYCVISNGGPGSCNSLPSTIVKIDVYASPVISVQPIANNYCQNISTSALTVTATNGGLGTLSYQWYSNSSNANTGGVLINSATNATYTPPNTTVGVVYYYVLVGNGATSGALACSSTPSTAVAIETYFLPTVTSQVTGSQSICLGSAAIQMSVTALAGGSSTITGYQWYSNAVNSNTGGAQIGGATSDTYTPPGNVTGSVYYYCEVTNFNGCKVKTAVSGSVNVYAPPIISGQPSGASYCLNSSSSALSVTANNGGFGTVAYQWYSNINNANTGGVLINSATNATYTPPTNAIGLVYYYVVVSNGGSSGCSNIPSNAVAVNIYSVPTISQQPVAANYCKNVTANALSVTGSTGGLGILSYQWYSNTINANTGGTIITSQISDTYTPSTSSVGTIYYYCVISNGGPGSCNSLPSTIVKIDVYASPVISVQPIANNYCQNITTSALTVTATNGGLGTLTYQWYSNGSNANTGGVLINSATNATYTPPNTTVGVVYYYVLVGNGATSGALACSSTPSTAVAIETYFLPTVTSQVTGSQSICLGSAASQMSVTALAGGSSTITGYQWYSNAVNANTGGAQIGGATSDTYTPPSNVAGSVFYYCEVTNSNGCKAKTAVSGSVNVYAPPVISGQPSGASYCLNATPSSLSVTANNGGFGTVAYQWYSNSNNANTGGVLINSATNATYTPPTNAIGLVYYYVVVSNGGSSGCSNIPSNAVAVNIYSVPTISQQPVAANYCKDAIATALSVSGSAGGLGTLSYQWYSNTSATTTNAVAINGQTATTYIPSTSSVGTIYYYCVISNGGPGSCNSLPSTIVKIDVYASPVIIVQPIANNYCQNITTSALTVTATNGGLGTLTYQWYSNSSNANTGGAPILGATSNTYTPPNTTAGVVYYYVLVGNGATSGALGCSSTPSTAVAIETYFLPTVTSQATGSQSICLGSAASQMSITALAGGSSTITGYQWYSNAVNSNTGGTIIGGATSNTYIPPTNVAGTKYYYCVISNSNNCIFTSIQSGAISVNLLPAISIQPSVATQLICLNEPSNSLSITASPGSGSINSYQWFSNTNYSTTGGVLIPNANSSSYTPISSVTGTSYYYVTVTNTNNCSTNSNLSAPITINNLPSITTQPSNLNQEVCLNSATTPLIVTANAGSGTIATYKWYSNTVNSIVGGTLIATHNSNATSDSYTPSSTSLGTLYYFVIVFNSNGCKVTSSVSGPVLIKPVAFIGNSQLAKCSGEVFTITPINAGNTIVPIGTTYTWDNPVISPSNPPNIITGYEAKGSQASFSQKLYNNSLDPATATYSIIPTSGSCEGSPFTMTLQVTPVPQIFDLQEEICSGKSFTTIPTLVPSNTRYTWTAPVYSSANAISGGSAQSVSQNSVSQILINNTTSQATATYTVTPFNGICQGASFQITVLVNPIATVAASAIPICSGSSFSFTPSNLVPLGTTYTWTTPTISPIGNITGMTNATTAQPDITQTLTNATDLQAQALYTVTPLSGTCKGPSFNLVATVNPIPKLSSSLNMGLYCSGKAFSYSLNSLTPNTTYSWSRTTNASISPSNRSGTSSTIVETLTNSSANPIVVLYTVVLTANNCQNTQTISVTIDPLPVANFNMLGDTSGCGPITRTFVNTTTVNGAAMTTGGNFKWEVFKNGVTSALLTQPLNNYSAHLDYTFTNTGTIDSVYEVVLTAYSENRCENVLRRKITVHPDAKAYFFVNSKAACTPFNIMLNNNLAPVNYTDANNQGTYVWTIYDKNRLAISSASSFTPPPFTITRPDDSVYVSLFVGPNYTGCRSNTYEQLLYTYENPIVNYTPSVLSGCSPLNVSVNNTSYLGKSFSVSNLTYEWYLNDIKSSTTRSELFKIVNSSNTADALVNIKLVVSESLHGCKDSSSASTVRVFPQPKPDFIITKSDPVCSVAGGSLQSVDDLSNSKNPVTTQYNWSILYDGSNLPALGVVITPTPKVKPTFLFPDNQSVSDTTYWVKLKLISVDNCIDSITRDIKLFRRPNVQFTLPVDTGCGSNNIWPIDVTTNIPESSISRVWTVIPAININNGNTKYPELIFPINNTNAAIVYAIKQKVTSFTGCTDERIRQFIVYPSPTSSFISTSSRMDSCGPWTRVFINTSDPKNGESINDPKFNFKWSVTIGGRVVYATSDNSARNLFTYKFTNTGLVDSQYVVTLWVQTMHGCDGVYSQTYTVHPNAKSFFDGDIIGCAPFNLRTHLKVKDFASANNPYTYEWRIYDRFGFLISRRDSIDVPNYTMLLETDTIRVQLIARSLWGCKDDIFERWVVTKSNSVKAKFISTSSSMCSDATVKLVNSSYVSSPGQSAGLTYSWFLNDDFIGNNKDTSLLLHNDYFNKDSNYIVKLVAEYSNSGCTDTLMSNLVVKPKPMANFSLTASDTCGSPLGVTRTIIDNSVAKPGNTKKIWQLYNNSLGSMSNITVDATTTANIYSFRLPDNQGLADSVFTILLNLASVDGCKADTSRKITLYRRPKVAFSFLTPNVCGQQKVQVLDATNNVANTKLWSYTTFRGGVLQIVTPTTTEPTIIVPPNTNSDEAFYFIKQTATTGNGCTDSAVATLTARPVPVANFSIDRDSSCNGVLNANFTDLSYTQTAGTLITNWSWKFDDGQLDIVNRNPTHNFVSQGAYMVSLVVTDNQLCQSIPFVKKVTVYGSPTANFSFGISKYHCLKDTIVAQNKSALGFRSTNFTSFQWDFGDGTTVSSEIAAKSPKHLYKLPGKYIVTLKVTSDSSCVIGRFTDTIFIIGPPVAGFKSDNNCVFTPINFTDTSKAGIYDLIGAYRWSFGDGSFDNIQNPIHVFTSAGTYPVKLIVNGKACPLLQDSTLPGYQLKIVDRRADSIYARKYIAYNNPTTICALPAGVNYNWSPAVDLSSTNISCPTINVTHRINNYLIKIIDSAGCSITDRVEIWGFMGNDIFLPRAFIPNNASVAENRILKPVYVGIKEIRYFKVFDRMGHEVFTTNSMSQYWDGTSNGKEVPTETYSWIILAIDEKGKELIRKGNVTLIRN